MRLQGVPRCQLALTVLQAEESSAAAQELSSQAVVLQGLVKELQLLVCGELKTGASLRDSSSIAAPMGNPITLPASRKTF